jgi:hypothetical protein
MKDGVEYVLRFGAGTSVVRRGDESAGDDDGERDEVPGRYLLVMARFNESLLEKPTLDPLPGEPEATEPEATEPEVTEPEATEPEATEPAATEPAATEPEATEPEATEPEASARRVGPFRFAAQAEGDASAAAEEAPAAEQPPAAEDAGDEAPPSPPPSAADALKAADEAEAKAQAAREERRRVERENRRKQEEYDEKVDGAKKRVRELNGRFAAWYYIVSDEEYAKIHLSRDEVIETADGDASADGGLGGLPNSPGFSLPPAGN